MRKEKEEVKGSSLAAFQICPQVLIGVAARKLRYCSGRRLIFGKIIGLGSNFTWDTHFSHSMFKFVL